MILGFRQALGLRTLFQLRLVEPAEGWISDFGRRLWDAPFLIKAYYKLNDFGPPAGPGLPDGFMASAGWVGRSLDFRSLAGGSRTSGLL